MAKYIEKSTMKQYIKNFCKGLIADNRRFDPVDDCALLCDVVNFALAADVVEVVRCKDCKHRRDETECPLLSLADFTEDDEFCSMGERKTDNA